MYPTIMEKKTVTLILLFVTLINIKSQTTDIKLKDIIVGTWNIEYRGTTVTTDNPDANENIDLTSELLKKEDGKIEFVNQTYILNSDKSGKYLIKGTTIYLDDKKYHFAIHNKDKFNLVRKINADCFLTYMIERKNK